MAGGMESARRAWRWTLVAAAVAGAGTLAGCQSNNAETAWQLIQQQQQEQALAQNQQAVREQASALETERNAARIRLTDLQGQIRSLEAEQNSADSDLVRSVKGAGTRKPARRR